MEQWVCKNCKSPAIEVKLFVQANTNKIMDDVADNTDNDNNTWCPYCENHTGIEWYDEDEEKEPVEMDDDSE